VGWRESGVWWTCSGDALSIGSRVKAAGSRGGVERARRFEALYVEHYPAIYAYVYRRLSGSASEVPDVVADVFATAWRRLDSVPAGDDGRLWLYSAARHVVLNDRRGWRRRLRLFDRLRGEASLRRAADDGAGESELWLVEAIERLPAADQEVLRLVRWEGLSHGEAAQVLGCSMHAVALRVDKAKARLRQDPIVAARLERSKAKPGSTARVLDARGK
jgi:RNA polymerase sigma-70 factor (ECF subfamily)